MDLTNACVHCGADCGKKPVVFNQQKFCCNGCKQVYQILNENKLFTYYSLENNPGIKIETPAHDAKYAFLDKESVQQKMYEFFDAGLARVTFYIPSIHCASCIWLLENLHKLNKGIKHASVNFVKKQLTVNFQTNEITLRQLVELLVSIHYIPDISLKTLESKDITAVDRSLMYKIGVAGFIFGNVMLYSLPEYFNGKPLGGSLGTFLYYLCFALTVPLVFYSGSDYILSAWKHVKKGIVNIDVPIAIGILTLFLVTLYEVGTKTGPGYSDSLTGFLFFLLVGKWYQSKTYQSLSFDRDYKSYFPVAVTRLSNNLQESVLLDEIKVDDILLIRSKELIPADSVLIEGPALIDYSFVTGESVPVKKEPGEFVYAGGVQTGGAIKVKVEHEVKQSHLTQLWNQSETKDAKAKDLTSIVDKISVYFTLIIIAIALAGFTWWFYETSFHAAVLVLTSVLIVACPCALALSLPFTLGTAMRIFGTKGLYIKNTKVIEKLTKVDTLVFDKTGTITVPDKNKVAFVGTPLNEAQLQRIVSVASQSTHPLSQALAKFYANTQVQTTSGFVEMSGRGVFAKVGSDEIKMGSYEFVNGQVQDAKLQASRVYVSVNNIFLGYFQISNQYRQGVESLILELKQKYQLYLLSGDNDSEREHLTHLFPAENLWFNQRPKDKMAFIEKLKADGNTVLMTGDGLNDAGAFIKSDVALSIADDIYHFSPAGDAIIDAGELKKLPLFVRFAKNALVVVKVSFIISFLYNIIGLSFAITGNLSPVVAAILMPVSSVSVVAFTTFTTRFLANRMLA